MEFRMVGFCKIAAVSASLWHVFVPPALAGETKIEIAGSDAAVSGIVFFHFKSERPAGISLRFEQGSSAEKTIRSLRERLAAYVATASETRGYRDIEVVLKEAGSFVVSHPDEVELSIMVAGNVFSARSCRLDGLPQARVKLAESDKRYKNREFKASYELLKEYRRSCAMNRARFVRLGNLTYSESRLGGIDLPVALAAYEQAAKLGSKIARNRLAGELREGNSYRLNHARAFALYSGTHEAGSKFSTALVADMLFHGTGTRRDKKVGMKLYEQCANAADKTYNRRACRKKLGIIFLEGLGVKVAHRKAEPWLKLALNDGDIQSGTWLGIINYERNKSKAALNYLSSAAETGDAQAIYYLGLMHLKGMGTEKSRSKAVSLFEKSAELGFSKAHDKMQELKQ
ncbi:MAG: tetratricopeptide repeat protein [Parasphingorhabdus sp.]|uniref:tetratricopeptide repeat protein n=1 Tax=Parasphingorhabdus sp. TaxID=2709688 RepID=UPI0032991309